VRIGGRLDGVVLRTMTETDRDASSANTPHARSPGANAALRTTSKCSARLVPWAQAAGRADGGAECRRTRTRPRRDPRGLAGATMSGSYRLIVTDTSPLFMLAGVLDALLRPELPVSIPDAV
jgi:hypothetical protein